MWRYKLYVDISIAELWLNTRRVFGQQSVLKGGVSSYSGRKVLEDVFLKCEKKASVNLRQRRCVK